MASGRVYTAVFEDVTVAAAQDLFNLLANTNVSFQVHWVKLMQRTLTASETVRIKYQRGTTAGSGGTTATVRPLADLGLPTADTTVDINDTTQGTPGVVIDMDGWNLINPYIWMPTPMTQMGIPGGGRLIVELEDAPTSCSMSGSICFEEVG